MATHDANMQEENVVFTQFLLASVFLIPVLVMQAYCMHDEKALVYNVIVSIDGPISFVFALT